MILSCAGEFLAAANEATLERRPCRFRNVGRFCPSELVLALWLQNYLAGWSIGFLLGRDENAFMFRRITLAASAPILRRCALTLGLALTLVINSAANTPEMLRRAVPTACRCGCNESQANGGCIKMCQTSRRASRWAANSCAKPRIKIPAATPGAGPRFPRSDRAERASR